MQFMALPKKKKKRFTPLFQFYHGLCTLKSPLVAKLGPQYGTLHTIRGMTRVASVSNYFQLRVEALSPTKRRSMWTGIFIRRWPGRWVALRVAVYGTPSVWLLNPWDRSCVWGWGSDTQTLPEPRFGEMDYMIPGSLRMPMEQSPFSWRKAHSPILNLNLGDTPGPKKKWSWKLHVSRN